ncbi:MAG: response regulator [Tepidisphaeraceae bacterium]
MSEAESPAILVLVRELMFSGKISAEARAAGVAIKIIGNPADLALFAQTTAGMLIVDLNLAEAIVAAAAWGRVAGRCVVGFVSHVDAQTIARAREAGIKQVLARSQFVSILPELVRRQAR